MGMVFNFQPGTEDRYLLELHGVVLRACRAQSEVQGTCEVGQ